MGITGLLSSLRSIISRVHVSKYKGLKVGIDAHCWLYRGSFSCSREITEGIKTTKFIHYFLELLNLLQAEGVIPVIVFDGRPLPAKSMTNSQRRESKYQNKTMAREAEADGREDDAKSFYQRSFSVTPEMVFQLIEELKRLEIEYIISPYESDAQLAFLSLSKYVDVVITEDSDALVYGCRCVLYKLDQSGYGEEIKRRSLGANEGLSFLNWSDEQFKMMCCLSGCDYAPKIRNVGIVTAHKIVNEHKTVNRIVDALRRSKYEGINDEYIQKFLKALYTFKHQTVYNPIAKSSQPLTPFGDSFDWRLGTDYLGEILDPMTSELLAKGEIHPLTLQPFQKPQQIEDDNPPRLKENKIEAGDRIQHLEKNSAPLSLVIDTSCGKEFGTNVWSSICSVKHEPSTIQHKGSDDDEIQVSNLWEFENLNPLKSKVPHHVPSLASPTSAGGTAVPPIPISKYDFQPVPGVETLHRRNKRIPSSDRGSVDTDHMTTEFHPWSASKKSKQTPLSMKNEGIWMSNFNRPPQQTDDFTESHDFHERLGMEFRSWNQNQQELSQTVRFDDGQDPGGVGLVNNVEFSVGSPTPSPILSQPSSDRYRKAGIMKIRPFRVPQTSNPFSLPKKSF